MAPILRGLSDIRRFFHRNDIPVYFVSATCFNLLGMDEWVRRFRFVNHLDCFDGAHPSVFVPPEVPHDIFRSIEDVNNYLLGHKQVVDYVTSRGPGKAVFLMFDERTEGLCRELDLEILFPSAALRRRIDDKVEATRIAAEAGVASVPNVLCSVADYADLRAKAGHLGGELVIQTPFGDSGHTTFFVAGEEDWSRCAGEVAGQLQVKVMRRIRCRGSAVEACVTRHGTIVGPIMTELVGFPELTPYRGGWCGNEVLSGGVDPATRQATARLGDAFGALGYRGYFEVDWLTDQESGEVYLGEVNPRITGASAMTNLAAFAHADAPLFLFHLLEFWGVDYELDVPAINARWGEADNIDAWSQLVVKHTGKAIERVEAAPRSGIWRLGQDGRASFLRVQTHRRTVERPDEGFFLRITRPGDYLFEGADLGILIAPGRLMDDDYGLTPRARSWVSGLRAAYRSGPVAKDACPPPPVGKGVSFKIL